MKNIFNSLLPILIRFSPILVVMGLTLGYVRNITSDPGDLKARSYGRVGLWIESVDCSREKSMYLVFCRDEFNNSVITAFEDISHGDDIGHVLLLYGVSLIKKSQMNHQSVWKLNLLINYLCFLMFCFYLIYLKQRLTALAVAFFGTVIWMLPSVNGSDVTATYLSLALVGIMIIHSGIRYILDYTNRSFLTIYLPISFLGFALINAIREPMGLAIAVTTATLGLLYSIKIKKYGRLAAIVIAFVIAKQLPATLINLRDNVYDMKGYRSTSHGISHNLFLGLGGVEPNKFGITWSDSDALNTARAVNPEVKYMSNEYFKILRDKYFHYVKTEPLEVIRIYLIKIRNTFLADRSPTEPAYLNSLILCGIFLLLNKRRKEIFNKVEPLFLASSLLGLLILAQGVLTMPYWDFIYPSSFLMFFNLLHLLLLDNGEYLKASLGLNKFH